MSKYLLAIDQGTTSSRAIIYDSALTPLAFAQQELPLTYPQPGWVEQDPEHIWQTVLQCMRQALQRSGLTARDIAGIGITNQRETSLLWHRTTGKTLYPAIVWQDRRGAAHCQQLKDGALEGMLQQKTGLLADPYFSASKLSWMLDNVPAARSLAEQGQLCFGTVDCYLLWQLTGGEVHATDASNASRTLLFNIHQQQWDAELLQLFRIPPSILPEVRDTIAVFGMTERDVLGSSVPILSMIGDQQAALVGQACINSGMSKSTYGTGCFMMANTGDSVLNSQHKLLSTVAWRINGQSTYALEGSIFMAGAIVQWLRDKLGVIQHASETEALAQQSHYQQSELLIPAFTGLGAPYWRADSRAALFGMTRDSGKPQLAAAALAAVAYQSRDLLLAMAQDGISTSSLRVDGGMTANNWFLQALADLSQCPVQRCQNLDATAYGVAFLTGLQLGMFSDISDISSLQCSKTQFPVELSPDIADLLHKRWRAAISCLTAAEQALTPGL